MAEVRSMLMLPARPAEGPAPRRWPARLLVVGGDRLTPCRVAGRLGPRGYELERIAEISGALDLAAFDLVIFALPPARADAVVAWCGGLQRPDRPALLVLHPADDAGYAVRVLEAGADDCLTAPHNLREVEARVRALLRRRDRNRSGHGGRLVVFDGLRLDAERRRVEGPDGRAVQLTESQHRLLAALLARPRAVVSREDLVAAVLGHESDVFDRAIDVHVSRLKKRIAQVSDADLISSYRGVGYRIDVDHVTH